ELPLRSPYRRADRPCGYAPRTGISAGGGRRRTRNHFCGYHRRRAAGCRAAAPAPTAPRSASARPSARRGIRGPCRAAPLAVLRKHRTRALSAPAAGTPYRTHCAATALPLPGAAPPLSDGQDVARNTRTRTLRAKAGLGPAALDRAGRLALMAASDPG